MKTGNFQVEATVEKRQILKSKTCIFEILTPTDLELGPLRTGVCVVTDRMTLPVLKVEIVQPRTIPLGAFAYSVKCVGPDFFSSTHTNAGKPGAEGNKKYK